MNVIYADEMYNIVQLSEHKFELKKGDTWLAIGDWTFVTSVAQQHGVTGSMVAKYMYLSH